MRDFQIFGKVKIVIAFLLAPVIGYMGVIISEPVVWVVMVLPLLVNMLKNPIFKQTRE
ncbi:MAG: hypothetical protein NC433_06265 [Clostridiales bacterium]|nr:hypothetical protein [Clostridiales bacterium]